jgi:mRNA (guanine-N7-)-methyltransferase
MSSLSETKAQKKKRDQSLSPARSPPRQLKRPKSWVKPNDREAPSQNDDDEALARPRKRPTNAAVISDHQRREARRRQEEREARGRQEHRPTAGVSDFVKQHYNAVPERGREWRKTDSKIKGLRSFNNWVKSALMHKCVPREADHRLKVLDIGCGKGGDLMKWQTQRIDLYVGIDQADVSIHQARERYKAMARRSKYIYQAEFIVKDCYGHSLEEVPAVKNVGFDKNIRERWGGGGFDVVAMMFCMHYAFESEEKARCMLLNVSASLKRGGKFIGVIPNSDVLSDKVNEFHRRKSGAAVADDDDDDWDPEKSLDAPKADDQESKPEDDEEAGPLSWGNSIYQVKFPGKLPKDGVFRPPYGWKYFYFVEEAVEQVPEFVVPWEAFRG